MVVMDIMEGGKPTDGGQITKNVFKIQSQVQLFKLNDRVFMYDDILYDQNDLKNLCNVLDKGLKFVPNLIDNEYNYFKYILSQIDNALLRFNGSIFLNKVNIDKEEVIDEPNFEVEEQPQNNINVRRERIIDYNKFKLQKETVDFRFNVIDKLLDDYFRNKKSHKGNLSINEIQSIVSFKKQKFLKVIQCDKNVGVLLISTSNHDILANDHLNNASTYRKLDSDRTSDIVDSINTRLTDLENNGHISKQLFNFLRIRDKNNIKPGKFKVLAKIHKEKFGIRPIINCIAHPTEQLCKFIDLLLQPLVKSINTILKDSQHLLQDMNKVCFNNKQYLYSCDFESLYTNMGPAHTIDSITEYLVNYTEILSSNLVNKHGFRTILDMIFTNNIFKFNDMFYLQQIGIPMGCKCGPSLANIYLYSLEHKYIDCHPSLIYYRFIDDIFIASPQVLDKNELCSQFPNLTLNIVEGEIINFLDLNINYDDSTKGLNFSLYVKPTNTFSYLLTHSNHPDKIFKNIPLSLFIRIRRICTQYLDYLKFSNLLIVQLCKRGYKFELVSRIARQIGDCNRDTLLPYKQRVAKDVNKNVFFFFKFNNNINNLKNNLVAAFKDTQKDNDSLENRKLFFVNKIDTNIGSLLIHDFKLESLNIKYSYKKCNKSGCKICKYSTCNYFLKSKGFVLPILNNSNCLSKGVVYIIKCKRCNIFYIGESKRKACERINDHLGNIRRFGKNLDLNIAKLEDLSETAVHFNTKGHNIEEDFQFFIFNINLEDAKRWSTETDLINLFLRRKIPLLNKKLNSIYSIRHLTFS
jgi:hypothetical protein